MSSHHGEVATCPGSQITRAFANEKLHSHTCAAATHCQTARIDLAFGQQSRQGLTSPLARVSHVFDDFDNGDLRGKPVVNRDDTDTMCIGLSLSAQ